MPLNSDVAAEHAQTTFRAERSINRPDDLLRLIHRWPRLAFELLAKAAAGDVKIDNQLTLKSDSK